MSTFDEQLATAMVAKLAGMTLKEVDEHTVQQSSAGPATKIDPLSFITKVKERKQQQIHIQNESVNQLAEQLYPLPGAEISQPTVQQDLFVTPSPQSNDNQLTFDHFLRQNPNSAIKQFDTIISLLEKIDKNLTILVKQENKKPK